MFGKILGIATKVVVGVSVDVAKASTKAALKGGKATAKFVAKELKEARTDSSDFSYKDFKAGLKESAQKKVNALKKWAED